MGVRLRMGFFLSLMIAFLALTLPRTRFCEAHHVQMIVFTDGSNLTISESIEEYEEFAMDSEVNWRILASRKTPLITPGALHQNNPAVKVPPGQQYHGSLPAQNPNANRGCQGRYGCRHK